MDEVDALVDEGRRPSERRHEREPGCPVRAGRGFARHPGRRQGHRPHLMASGASPGRESPGLRHDQEDANSRLGQRVGGPEEAHLGPADLAGVVDQRNSHPRSPGCRTPAARQRRGEPPPHDCRSGPSSARSLHAGAPPLRAAGPGPDPSGGGSIRRRLRARSPGRRAARSRRRRQNPASRRPGPPRPACRRAAASTYATPKPSPAPSSALIRLGMAKTSQLCKQRSRSASDTRPMKTTRSATPSDRASR